MTDIKGKVVFAGGGTGGHIYPALATIEALRQKNEVDLLYIGSRHGIEKNIIPAKRIDFKGIWIAGFKRGLTLKNLLFPIKLGVSLFQSWKTLKRFNPGVVVGTGGYVSGPVVYMASRMKIPTIIQEQDRYPGVTTRLLAKYADVVCAAYPDVKNSLNSIRGEFLVTGNPVRKSLKITDKEDAIRNLKLDPSRPVLFVFGGSQGAHSLNKAIRDIGEFLTHNLGLQIIWQSGIRNFDEVNKWEISENSAVHVFPYIEEMEVAYSAANVILSRAGAITLAELAFASKPAILVPYPFAAANHQLHNARAIAAAGAAIMIEEDESLSDKLKKSLEQIVKTPQMAEEMSQKWKEFYYPQAADTIANKIVQMMEKSKHDETWKN